ncbi:hypothetical protein LTR78_000736 [Recurvomyces mirabilis]|uniref:Zn(2)-C6 fungal-type domain-containing protein n=1 Tax=Recurvomyces mirabilis TaxID=574656 RepID=A0AAE0WVU0_9PEZI|nr:hypothetical protein LTR78_000736 [Recurvomyces mirabilis]KAK5158706.1 hypothetical protein LTS14_002814 [Recurvomyces mirabilis]
MDAEQSDTDSQAKSRYEAGPPTNSVPSQQPTVQTPQRRDNHTPSCLTCQRRKVKCNRVYPCAACLKTGLQCEFKADDNAQSRKKRKRTPDGDGSSYPSSPHRTTEHDRQDPSSAQLHINRTIMPAYAESHQTYYPKPQPPNNISRPGGVSGHSIYESAVSLGTELASHGDQSMSYDPKPSKSNKSHFLFNPAQQETFSSKQHARSQPPAHHVVQLWQTYLTNVDPILKVLHAPTLQQTVLGQIGKPSLPAGLQAMTSAIYFISTVSLQNNECQASLQVSKAELLTTYRSATEDALSAAAFVTTTDVQVLQALVLYLTALESLGETATVWSMSGLAFRQADTLSLVSENNATKLSPFETEMRRRLWWALVLLDHRTAESMGKTSDVLKHRQSVKLPTNLTDTQLFSSMLRLPESRPTATEMSYVLLQATIASHLDHIGNERSTLGSPSQGRATPLRDLEYSLEEEILRFCDTTVPLQAYTINAAYAALAKLRLDQVKNNLQDEEFSASAFAHSLKVVELYLDLTNEPQLQRWKWQWGSRLPWSAFRELVYHFRIHPESDSRPAEVCTAERHICEMVEKVLPTFHLEPRKAMALELMRGMLAVAHEQSQSVAASTTDPALLTGEQAKTASLAVTESPGSDPAARTARKLMTQTAHPHGSRPFAALLPGMDVSARAAGQQEANGTDQFQESATRTRGAKDAQAHAHKVDWIEFDRLAGELCK